MLDSIPSSMIRTGGESDMRDFYDLMGKSVKHSKSYLMMVPYLIIGKNQVMKFFSDNVEESSENL